MRWLLTQRSQGLNARELKQNSDRVKQKTVQKTILI